MSRAVLLLAIRRGFAIAPVFCVRVSEVGFRYAFNLVLANVLGLTGTGQFYLGLSIVTVIASVARFGMDNAAVKHAAIALAAGRRHEAGGIVATTLASTAFLGLLLSAVLFVLARPISSHIFGHADLAPTLRGIAFGIVAMALQTAAGSLLNALDRPVLGQVVSAVAWPALAMVYVFESGRTAADVSLATVLIMAAAALTGVVLLWSRLDGAVARPSLSATREIVATAIPLFGVEMIYLLLNNLPVIVLGLFASEQEVGLLSLASRMSMLQTVFSVAMFGLVAPRMARLHSHKDIDGLRFAACHASRTVSLLALPCGLVLLSFPALMMGLFGEAFRAAAPLLVVLTVGQMINTLLSQSHTLLAMTGHERGLWHSAIVALLVMAVGLAVLVPAYGVVGAAIAAALGTVAMSICSATTVFRALRINVLAAYGWKSA